MPEPITPERLAEIRRQWTGGVMGAQTVFELLAEVDRLKAELAEMESAASDWAARLIEEKSKTSQAESRITEALDLASRLDPSCGRGRVQAFISDLRRALGRAVSL